MSRTNVPVTQMSRAGVAAPTPTAGDATNGNSIVNDGGMFLLLTNADSGSSHTATIHLPATQDGQSITSKTVSVAASGSTYAGPWPVTFYGNPLQVDVDSSQLKLSPLHA